MPFRAFPSPGAVSASRRPDALLSLPTDRACGPEGPLAKPGDTALDWLPLFAKGRQVRRDLDPDPRPVSRLQGVAPRDESVARTQCLSAPRAARCSPGISVPLQGAPPRRRASLPARPRRTGLCSAKASHPPASLASAATDHRPEGRGRTRVGVLLGVLTASGLVRARENSGQTLVRFPYLVRVLLSERAASPWLCVHLGGRAASPQRCAPLFGR